MTTKQIQATYNRIANDDTIDSRYDQEIISELLAIIKSELLTK